MTAIGPCTTGSLTQLIAKGSLDTYIKGEGPRVAPSPWSLAPCLRPPVPNQPCACAAKSPAALGQVTSVMWPDKQAALLTPPPVHTRLESPRPPSIAPWGPNSAHASFLLFHAIGGRHASTKVSPASPCRLVSSWRRRPSRSPRRSSWSRR